MVSTKKYNCICFVKECNICIFRNAKFEYMVWMCPFIVDMKHVSIFLCIYYIFGRILTSFNRFSSSCSCIVYLLLVDVLFLFYVLFYFKKRYNHHDFVFKHVELNWIGSMCHEMYMYQYDSICWRMCTLQARNKLIKFLSFN